MIKKIYQNFIAGLEVSHAKNELQKQIFESQKHTLKESSSVSRSSGVKEARDTEQRHIPGSHDDYYELPTTEQEMVDVLEKVRIVVQSPFARNAIENRINYVLGDGFTYKAMEKIEGQEEAVEQVQEVIDTFLKENRWHKRQEEIILRQDRDGEVFIQMFDVDEEKGFLQTRFIEPEYIVHPESESNNPDWYWGILNDEDDVETALEYNIDTRFVTIPNQEPFKERVDAKDVQHRKINVDAARKRGWSTFAPIRQNIERVNTTLRNAGTVTSIQAAIAMIRRHESTKSRIEKAQEQSKAGVSLTGHNLSYYPPGAILDSTSGTEYDFPASGIDPTKITGIIQAELRAVGARFNQPEFMISGDASNANYSSTLVSEGPFVRSIQRLQRDMKKWDEEILDRVINNAMDENVLPRNIEELVEVEIICPDLTVRDFLEQAKIVETLIKLDIMSKETAASQFGIEDYEEERLKIADESERDLPPIPDPFQMPPPVIPNQQQEVDDEDISDGDETDDEPNTVRQ